MPPLAALLVFSLFVKPVEPGQGFRAIQVTPSKPRPVNVLVTDEAGRPIPGCPVSPSWQVRAKVMFPVGGAVTDGEGRATLTTSEAESLIAVYQGRIGTAAGADSKDKTDITVILRQTSPVKLSPRYSPPLKKGEKLAGTCRIVPISQESDPRKPYTYMRVQGGIELPLSGATDVDLPAGKYVAFSQMSGINTATLLTAPAKIADLYIHWEPSIIGKLAPKIEPTRVIGSYKGLESLRGKWVYVDFWATWCQPCIAGMPKAISFYERNRAKRSQFEILAVHAKSGSEPEKYAKAIAKIKKELWKGQDLPFPVLFDGKGQINDLWRVSALPSSFLIDPQGRVIQGGLEVLQKKLN